MSHFLKPINIVTKDNLLTKRLSDPEEATNKGYWHRGVHVAVYTKDGFVLVQKRSASMVYHPGLLEIGVGGYVDADEKSKNAAVREIYEETGITADMSKLEPISMVRYNYRWNFFNRTKIERVILYTYLYELPSTCTLRPQKDEVEWSKFMPIASVEQLVWRHRLKQLGVLSTRYGYYRRLIKAVRRATR